MRGGAAALEEVVKSNSTAAELASLVLMRAALKTDEAFKARSCIQIQAETNPEPTPIEHNPPSWPPHEM